MIKNELLLLTCVVIGMKGKLSFIRITANYHVNMLKISGQYQDKENDLPVKFLNICSLGIMAQTRLHLHAK